MSNQIDLLLLDGPQPEPRTTTPQSGIDPTLPVYGKPTTQSVRNNFATAQTEISALMGATQGAPFLPLGGAHMTGPMYLYNDPTDAMMPATKGYVDAGGSGGGGGLPEAPANASTYGRHQGAWVAVLDLAGSSAMTADLLLAGNPTAALAAVPKQYVDSIAASANAAVPLAGGTMTGLLILSGDPSNALGAVTKQYADGALALKAPIASPTFTGTVNTAARLIMTGPSGPSLTLFDSTPSRPSFGIWNNASLLSFGLTNPTTGVPSGPPVATMDQSGNFGFTGRLNVTGGRLISSGMTNPCITVNNTGGGAIFGLWNAGNSLLAFGVSDPNGVPQTSFANLDTSGNLNIAGRLTAQGGTVGVTNGSSANAGMVGEVVSASVPTFAWPGSNAWMPAVEITLTPGDWDVYGQAAISGSTGGTITVAFAGICASTATPPQDATVDWSSAANIGGGVACVPQRMNLTASTTIQVQLNVNYTGTINAGGSIWARRAR